MTTAYMALILTAFALVAADPTAAQDVRPWYKQPFDPARVTPCDRACLIAHADQFLTAMEAHDTRRLPLAETVFVTENSAPVALGEDGRIAPFAKDCVRHEKGYRTVNNEKPGRAAPAPALPDPSTPIGKLFSQLSVMTCEQQVSTGIFAGIKQIWPRRMVVDELKGLVAVFPLFMHDGTRRPVADGKLGNMRAGLGMVINLVTMETFGIRGGQIHEVEAFPFVTLPYRLGDGWSPATGRAQQE